MLGLLVQDVRQRYRWWSSQHQRPEVWEACRTATVQSASAVALASASPCPLQLARPVPAAECCQVAKNIKQYCARQATASHALTLGAPKILKSLLAQFCVAGSMLDCPMTKPVLNCPRIMPCIGQRVAAGVPQHVDVNLEWASGTLADALD